MKLKNKKTGETGYYLHTHRDYKTGVLKVAVLKDGVPFSEFKPYEPIYDYDSLAELNEEWCDYEEPEEYWFIDYDGGIIPFSRMKETATDRMMKQIGNYFDSREEAEKAVEKLKAWKRLKDKGFRFRWIDMQIGQIKYSFFLEKGQKFTRGDEDDLLLLFGGEE